MSNRWPSSASPRGASALAPLRLPAERVVRYAHESEAHLASYFDRLGVAYEYEPVEFVLEWDDTGRETLGFRPDFYLPEFDLFVELTTLRQRLVTRKNRKVRTLRALYPEIRIEILYQRDYEALMAGQEPEVLAELLTPVVARTA